MQLVRNDGGEGVDGTKTVLVPINKKKEEIRTLEFKITMSVQWKKFSLRGICTIDFPDVLWYFNMHLFK